MWKPFAPLPRSPVAVAAAAVPAGLVVLRLAVRAVESAPWAGVVRSRGQVRGEGGGGGRDGVREWNCGQTRPRRSAAPLLLALLLLLLLLLVALLRLILPVLRLLLLLRLRLVVQLLVLLLLLLRMLRAAGRLSSVVLHRRGVLCERVGRQRWPVWAEGRRV